MKNEVTGIVHLSEFKGIIEEDADLLWGVDPRGPITIKISTQNDDTSVLPPNEGFHIRGNDHFFECYEFYDGVAIHTDNCPNVIEKIRVIATKLGSNVFFFN